MIDLFLPATTRLIIYPTPINTRWGPERLRAACEQELGVELDRSTGVLFHNRAKDTLVVYSIDHDGDRCITKKLERGTFLLPVRAEGQKYVVLKAKMINALFRSSRPKPKKKSH